ncbi:TetR/AcrR family transcriptional regulator [Gordonia shandongensis]|uniref:TetR/AcrR family transcriptional regulator n=1 Tax=Gordonia shandongensis TaxID=376351 RepID=UPI00040D4F62|nr:TetR/AcrR family transcriptional regulator [Gordonia shandongensis]
MPAVRKARITASVGEQERDILAAAAAEFTEVGVRRTSMDEVAGRAGVSRSTLYRRFPNKDTLFVAVAHDTFETTMRRIEDVIAGLPPAAAVVEAFAVGADIVHTDPLLRRMVLEDHAVRDLTASVSSLFIEMVTARIAATLRVAGAVMDDDDLHEAVEIHVRLVISYMETPSSDPDRQSPAAVRRFAEKFLAPMIH